MQDSLPPEKVFDTGGYLATFRHRAKMTIGWKFNKGIQEDQNSRLTTIIGGSASGIFPHSQDPHRRFTPGEDIPNLFFRLELTSVSSGCDGNLQHALQPTYPSESPSPSFSPTFRSSLRSVAEATCVHPAPCQISNRFSFPGSLVVRLIQVLNPPRSLSVTCSSAMHANVHSHGD